MAEAISLPALNDIPSRLLLEASHCVPPTLTRVTRRDYTRVQGLHKSDQEAGSTESHLRGHLTSLERAVPTATCLWPFIHEGQQALHPTHCYCHSAGLTWAATT